MISALRGEELSPHNQYFTDALPELIWSGSAVFESVKEKRVLYGWELLTAEEEELIARGIKKGKVFSGPFHLALFPTDRCNMDCFFCYTEALRQEAAELEWELLRRALEEGLSMGLKGVSFGGGGEPFIYGRLQELLDFIVAHSLKIDSVKTNGTPLTKKVADQLVRGGLKRLTVSLNETRREAFARMGGCSPELFDKAIKGIQNIVAACKESADSACEVSVQIFVWRENYQRLPEMIEDLLPLGADLIYINTIDQLPSRQRMSEAEQEQFKTILTQVLQRWAPQVRLNLMGEGLQEFGAEEHYKYYPPAIVNPEVCQVAERIEYCYLGWYALVIEATGQVYPCCHFATDKAKALGNLKQESLREIWEGKRAQRYRKEMRHLLLTQAKPELLLPGMRYVGPLCMERSACAFNLCLASPSFYERMEGWAKSSPRRHYQQRLKYVFPLRRLREKIGRRLGARRMGR